MTNPRLWPEGPRNWLKSTLWVTGLLAFNVRGQVLDFAPVTGIPSCATTCAPLQEAQAICVPPKAGTNSQEGYVSCFCAQAQVRPLYYGNNGVCDATCGSVPNALSQLRAWFALKCAGKNPAAPKSPGAPAAPGAASGAAPGAAPGAVPGAVPGAAPGAAPGAPQAPIGAGAGAAGGPQFQSPDKPTATPTKNTNTNSNTQKSDLGSRIDEAAVSNQLAGTGLKVVIGLVVTVVLVTLLAFALCMLRRRRRKILVEKAQSSNPIVWGPHQHQNFTHGYGYNEPSGDIPGVENAARIKRMSTVMEMPNIQEARPAKKRWSQRLLGRESWGRTSGNRF